MTELLYLKDSYLKEFEGNVISVEGDMVELDKTLFYPESGGQPADHGKITKDGEEYNVLHTKKDKGRVLHQVDKEGLAAGDVVHGAIDWKRRYKHMRSHTAAHVVSGMFSKESTAKITGNQLSEDKIRIDFNLENFDRELMEKIVKDSNELIEKDLKITDYEMPRPEVEKDPEMVKLSIGLPPGIKILRIVDIKGFDRQPDGGTHVKSLKEVGKLEIMKMDNKGKNNRRLYIKLKE